MAYMVYFVPVPRSCDELKTRGLEDSALVSVDPDYNGEIQVFCNLQIEPGQVYTVIGEE